MKLISAIVVFVFLMTAVSSHSQDTGERIAQTRLIGLRTVIYSVPDLDRAKAWYVEALGIQPYFDEPFYVGFNVGGYELALSPTENFVEPADTGVMVYWGVDDINQELAHFLDIGATLSSPVENVGGNINI